MQDEIVLCAASSYEKKYYLNPEFDMLPAQVKEELQAMSVLFTEEMGGLFEILFNDEGELLLRTSAGEDDIAYDEIGAGLLVKELRKEHRELFEELTLFFRVVFLGEVPDEDT